jgi:hypothetical protein
MPEVSVLRAEPLCKLLDSAAAVAEACGNPSDF